MSPKKGYKQTEEHIRKRFQDENSQRKRIKTRKKNGWFKNKKEFVAKMIKINTGRSRPDRAELNRKVKPKEMQGKNNPNWKGGITPLNRKLRNSLMYANWRQNVFLRDNHRCQRCYKYGGYLEAHHIKSFAEHPELRFDLSNGITLCTDCHKIIDNKRGRPKCKK